MFQKNDSPFRPPAVPLVVHDPYFSVWSFADCLTDEPTKHWTGCTQRLGGLIGIDGATFRFCGADAGGVAVPAMRQRRVEVLPTRTIYEFEAAGVALTVTFLSPALPFDREWLGRPVAYVFFAARSLDGRTPAVRIYFEAGGELVVNDPGQEVVWSRLRMQERTVLHMASREQETLKRSGDNVRIDWGNLYLAGPEGAESACGRVAALRASFVQSGGLPETDDFDMPRKVNAEGWDQGPSLAFVCDLGKVDAAGREGHCLLAYDDRFSLEYFHRKVRPWWRRAGAGAEDLLCRAAAEREEIRRRCEAFDTDLMEDARNCGGEGYARLCALSFRQCLGAHKLAADFDGSPLYMSKENFSNGCINTVDVTYPSAPFFLLFNPELLKSQLTPIFDYALSPRWKFPFAPHDLGIYPLANGQAYGGGETSEKDQMPVEECGNMLILTAALVKAEGSPDYARKYWALLQRWAGYLKEHGLDPGSQLCTDDFAGHWEHNANLSLKAILGLASYAQLAGLLGKQAEAAEFRTLAEGMARQWVVMAEDGDHYRLAFDKPGSWSQKYNMVWDRLLGLDLFPPEVCRKEWAFYRDKQNTYGLPLDGRSAWGKLDWTVWTASLAEDHTQFLAMIDPLVRWAHETKDRAPLADWYATDTGKKEMFQARSVVGGLFIRLLMDEKIRDKWRRASLAHKEGTA